MGKGTRIAEKLKKLLFQASLFQGLNLALNQAESPGI